MSIPTAHSGGVPSQNGGPHNHTPHYQGGGGGGGGSAPPSLSERYNHSPLHQQGRSSLPPDIRTAITPDIRGPPSVTPPNPYGRSPHTPPRRGGRASPPPRGRGSPAVTTTNEKKQILSRNINGTFVMTTQPTNESELQLYRVLQRANLLHYYDTFISQGGDDVQQLCEAGEEEFLEIMALVGMASKPLHVRRLQKALQEWVQNPGVFQSPLVSSLSAGGGGGGFHNSPVAAVIRATGGQVPTVTVAPSVLAGVSIPSSGFPHSLVTSMAVLPSSLTGTMPSLAGAVPSLVTTFAGVSSLAAGVSSLPPSSVSALLAQSRAIPPSTSASPPPASVVPARPLSSNSPAKLESPRLLGARLGADQRDLEGRGLDSRDGSNPSPPTSHHGGEGVLHHPGGSTSPLQLTPVLVESQIQRIADTASALVKSLPDLEPKQPNAKKKICKELEYVMGLSEEDDRKMDEIRKFSAIYGRFDCKRKQDKPLTLHEVSVNEAAAQICRLVPAMLTRRDELFPLARQVVRDSGYQYSKGHSRSTFSLSGKFLNGEEGGGGPFKRMRFAEDAEITQRRRERLDQINEEARLIGDRLEELRGAGGSLRLQGDLQQLQQISQQVELLQSKQQQLAQERDEHQRYIRYSSRMSTCSDPERGDTDDENSQKSYSNASSPSAPLQAPPNYVLSASGGQIIAVQNPALSLSGAFSSAGRNSPPTSVLQPGGGALLRGTPPNIHSPGLKQEPSSPPPLYISNHNKD